MGYNNEFSVGVSVELNPSVEDMNIRHNWQPERLQLLCPQKHIKNPSSFE